MAYCLRYGPDRHPMSTPDGIDRPPALLPLVELAMNRVTTYRYCCELARGEHPEKKRWVRQDFIAEYVKVSNRA